MPDRARTFYIENLGCPKNAVEGEGMAERLTRAGYLPAETASLADVIIVNTCAFIRPAQEESIDRLFYYLNRRRPGQRVIAAGCLAERFGEALDREIPELDGIIGTRRWYEIDRLVEAVERGLRACWHGAAPAEDPTFQRRAAGPTAYVKIAEGCNMSCTFCAIPSFKGPQRSKPPEEIIEEIRQLVAGGVREVILVSQNTTAYGFDRVRALDPSAQGAAGAILPDPPSIGDGERVAGRAGMRLARLLEAICRAVPELPWLRFHYCYPGWVDDDLLRTMARLDQVVKYLDIPLQHAHPEILRAMNRPRDVAQVKALLARARDLMPDVALRTTFIVGFPGETEEHVEAVLRFMEEVEFDHVGVFPFYAEEGTPAAGLPGQVAERTKLARKRRLLEAQQAISLARNRRFVGRELEVLVEGVAEESPRTTAASGVRRLVGRTFRDAPEVDGFVLFSGRASRGAFARVHITGAGPYDLFGHEAGTEPLPVTGGRIDRTTRAAPAARIGRRALPVLQPR